MDKKAQLGKERRRYIRLDSVFPVQFRLLSVDSQQFLSKWLQGFTNNVGKGGICLNINNLNPEFAKALKERQAKLSLEIEMPLGRAAVNARAEVIWVKEALGIPDKYLVGLSYEEINPLQNKRIMRYAWMKKLFVPLALNVIIVLGLLIALNTIINLKLIAANKALVGQLVKIVQESSVAKQKIKELNREREDLQVKIQALQVRMQTVEEERHKLENNGLASSRPQGHGLASYSQSHSQSHKSANEARIEVSGSSQRIEGLNNLIAQLAKEKNSLQEQLIAVQRQENLVAEDLLKLDKKKTTLEKANLDKMYQWLKAHQNPRTGLVISFEGDNDLANWAFTYDQSLVAQAYINFSDFGRAQKIFDFFNQKAKRENRQFFNAYDCLDGSPIEHTVHSGPNIWLGIAIMHYIKKTNDNTYLDLAEEIAKGVIDLQSQDGGIRGGPNVEWYSTEHNLDAHAFFNMLYNLTLKPQYSITADKVLNWLIQHTYGKADIPVKRGKGDSTIATDTYAWSIAAIGPEKLEAFGLNPDRILEFAEDNCAVTVAYLRPEGNTVKIRGFDFAPQKHLARGGVVSSEWTAQMVIVFKIMSDFYYKKGMPAKARAYAFKADEYLAGLSNMIISSPSPSGQGASCLPYATEDFVDTGHGWVSPKGKSTGSLAATVYALFAYYNYNPLKLED